MTAMSKMHTNLPFWGSRTYLQSSQLIDELGRILPHFSQEECHSLNVKFRSFLRSQGEFYLLDKDRVEQAHQGIFTLRTDGGKITLGLRETDIPVASRIDDDEKQLMEPCEILPNEKTGRINEYDPKRFFAVTVALNKRLIQELSPPEKGQAWILAALDMDNPFAQADCKPEIQCRVISVIANKMIKTQLLMNGVKAGSTVFTKVEKP